jgi:hypothetical protein
MYFSKRMLGLMNERQIKLVAKKLLDVNPAVGESLLSETGLMPMAYVQRLVREQGR